MQVDISKSQKDSLIEEILELEIKPSAFSTKKVILI